MKLVSVIIPIYKVEKYLEQCVNSVRKQSYANLEIILVDDGSPDSCGLMCEQFRKEDSRIKVIHKENAGLGYARNSGLDIATGVYILFIDSDDWIDTNMVSIMVGQAEEHIADMVVCGYNKYSSRTDNQLVRSASEITIFEGREQIVKNVFCPIIGGDVGSNTQKSRGMCVWINLYSMDIIRKNKLRFVSEREFLSEDLFFNTKYMLRTNKVVMIPECLYYYRFNPTSLSNAYRPNKVELMQSMYERAFELLDEEGVRKDAGYRLERSYMMRLRHCLMIISEANINKAEKLKKYKTAVSYPLTQKIASYYPYNGVPMKEKLLVKLIQAKNCTLLKLYLDFQGLLISIRDKRYTYVKKQELS